MFIYTVGRPYLLELYHSELQSHIVRIVDGPTSRRAYEQLMGLETEMRESGIVYTCLPGQHDDLGISCAMLAWAARPSAFELVGQHRFVRMQAETTRPRQRYSWGPSRKHSPQPDRKGPPARQAGLASLCSTNRRIAFEREE
jgi:hypothetical protein